MKIFTLVWMVSIGLMLGAPAGQKSGSSDASQKKAAPKSEKSNRQVQDSLTGCVDEQDGKYVLLDDHMLKKLANLETSIAPSQDVFAKHVGHKVTVRGNKSSAQENMFQVASIEEIAAVCAPAQETKE